MDHKEKSITTKRTNAGPRDADKSTPVTKKARVQCRWSNLQPSDGREYIYTSTDDMTLDDVLSCMQIAGRHARVGFPNDGTFVVDCRTTSLDRRGELFSSFMRTPSNLGGGLEIIYDRPWAPVPSDVNREATRVFECVLTSPGPVYGPVYLTFSPSLAAVRMCREMSSFITPCQSRDGTCHGLAPWARVGMVNLLTHPAMDSLSMDVMDNICSLLKNVTREELESRHPEAVNYLLKLSDTLDTVRRTDTSRLATYLIQTYPNRASIGHLLSEVLVEDVTHAVYEYLGMHFDVYASMPSEIFITPASGIVTHHRLLPEPPFDNACRELPTRKARDILRGFRWESIHKYRVFHDYLVDDMLKLLTKRRSSRSFIWRIKELLATKSGRQAHSALWCTIVHLDRVAQTTCASPTPMGWPIMDTIDFPSHDPLAQDDVSFLSINLNHPLEQDELSQLYDANEGVNHSATVSILYQLPIADQRRGPSPDNRHNGWVFVEHAPNGVFFTRADIARVIVERFTCLDLRNWNERFGQCLHHPSECVMTQVNLYKGMYTFDYDT